MNEFFENTFKIVIIGDSEVGKTNIIRRLCKGDFNENYQPTIGVEFTPKKYHIDQYDITIQLWETAGLEMYRSIVSPHYAKALGAVIVFDVTQPKTFESIERWIKDLEQDNQEDLIKVLIGNKIDLEAQRLVSQADAQNLAYKFDCLYVEASALSGRGIQQSFAILTDLIYQEKMKSNGPVEPIKQDQKAPQNIDQNTQNKQACCIMI